MISILFSCLKIMGLPFMFNIVFPGKLYNTKKTRSKYQLFPGISGEFFISIYALFWCPYLAFNTAIYRQFLLSN